MTRYPTLSALCFSGVSALLVPSPGRADQTPPPAASPSSASAALTDLEARSPKDWSNPLAIAELNAEVMRLVETNTLQSAEEFYRAAALIYRNLGEFRTGRVHYELYLAAAALGHPGTESGLHASWDILLGLLGRPCRVDTGGMATTNPDFFQLDPAPGCIQAVLRNPAAARAALATAKDNPEIKTLVDADQAVRQTNWSTLTEEQRKANSDGDRQRNARMIEIVNAGDVHTANDFTSASLVMQHSPRFSGFQLAHELAVCSMLLGDRSTGRWLVAATYDRMLRSIGHDQRFGTQFSSNGPQRIDEIGICDAERQALGCRPLAKTRALQVEGSMVVPKTAGGKP